MSHGINDKSYVTLKYVSRYDVIHRESKTYTSGEVLGSVAASQLLIPNQTVQEDIANSKLSNQEYIDLCVSLGLIKEVV